MGSIIAVAGDGEGAGATTVVSLVGAALSEQLRQAALVDGTRNGTRLSDAFDVEPAGEIVETIRRGRNLMEARTNGPHGTDLFLGTEEAAWDAVPSASIENCYEQLRERVEIGLVDLGPVVDPSAVPWIGHADALIVVTDADGPRQTEELATIAATFDVEFRGVIVNDVAPDRLETTAQSLADDHMPLLAVLPADDVASASAEAGVSALSYDPDSQLSTVGWMLAERLAGTDEDDPIVPDSVSLDSESGGPGPAGAGPDAGAASTGTETRATGDDGTGLSSSSSEPERTASSTSTDGTDDTVTSADDTAVSTDDLQAGDTDTLTDTVDDSIDDWGDFDQADANLQESEQSSTSETEGELGDWRDSTSGESGDALDDLDGSTTGTGNELDDWRDDDGDGLDDLQGSTDSDGLNDWRESDPGDSIGGSTETNVSEDDAADDDDVEEEIEAAFQEAMEQTKDDDDEPSIDDLLE